MPQGSDLGLTPAAFATRLLEVQEVSARAQLIAHAIVESFPNTVATVYILEEGAEGAFWSARAKAGEGTEPDPVVPAEAGTLGTVFRSREPVVFEGRTLVREDYAHLNVRRTVRSLVCIPLVHQEELVGCIEALSFEEAWDRSRVEQIEPLAAIAGAALLSAQAYEVERNNTLNSITRLTQFYDIEKVFSSTLEMNDLLPIIGGKMREMLECQAINLWMVQGDGSLLLMHQAGWDPSTQQNMVQNTGEGLAVTVSDTGEPILIAEPGDEQLALRNVNLEDGRIESLMVAPILDKESLVGVVEAVNRLNGSAFTDDDLFVLSSLNETAGIALHNASLLLAERKVEILETLVTVSHEITSTLNLERVLQTVVNAPQAVIPYERAAIALDQNGKFKLSAVTGLAQVDPDAPNIAPLNDVLRWVMLSEGIVHVRQHEDQIDTDREETAAKFRSYFESSGMRGFYAIPLTDDTGRVGVLGLESADPDFLTPAHIEILQVLAGQATVALRNAQMYKEVPFISVLEPVLERKRRFMRMGKRRRVTMLLAAGAAIVFLAAFPWPLRVDGDALVAPARTAQLQPEVEGIVSNVYVREGDRVTRNQPIAQLADWDIRSALAQAQAKYQEAVLQMNRALAASNGSEGGLQRVQADYWKSEVDRDQKLLDAALLRSPIDGIVATPHIENMVGRRLNFGDSLAEIVDTSQAIVDVTIDGADVGIVHTGAAAVIKLNSYPMRTFRGDVAVVSPKATLQGDSQIFFARIALPNPEGTLRAGMEGQGKVRAGWYPAGYALFRRPLLWAYAKLWSWFGI